MTIVRNGSALHSLDPAANRVRLQYVDRSFDGDSYYYLRLTQVDTDEHGNASRAWSSPIWVKKEVPTSGSF